MIITLELLFILFTTRQFNHFGLILLFSLCTSLFIHFFISLIKEKYRKIIAIVIITIISIIYIANFFCYQIFGTILSFSSIGQATQAISFTSLLIEKIVQYWYVLLLFIIPSIVMITLIIKNKIYFKRNIKFSFISLGIIYIILLGIVWFDHDGINAKKNLYFYSNNSIQNLKTFGLLTTIRLDIKHTIFGLQEKKVTIEANGKQYDKGKYHILDMDFDKIPNEEVANYLKNQTPTNKNEYTGLLKEKNLIIIFAESLSDVAIKEEVTPTLYKIYNNGLKFKNYYAPLYPLSTADSEYMLDNSLLPVTGKNTLSTSSMNVLPYNYGTVFKKEKYYLSAYHNFQYDYYDRESYFKQLEYDLYQGCGNGLEDKINCNNNVASDYEMIKNTIDDYINQESFLTYYVTMSGHFDYSLNQAMVRKNYDSVKDLPYLEKSKYYLASQIELDKALEELINRLEKANKLNDTVILLVGDHYPYGLSIDEINSLSDYSRDEIFEKVRVPFVIYNPQIEKQEIDKYCSNLDVLPTILNLFDVSYDSRLLMGKDIFSEESSPIIFYNHSFIMDSIKYNAIKEQTIGTISNEELEKLKQEIYLKFKISRLIFDNNYYQYIMD